MQVITSIGFEPDDPCLEETATKLAADLHLTVTQDDLPRLHVDADKLSLLTKNFTPLFVDFSHQHWKKRREEGKKQGLVQACKPHQGLKIVDVSAGWGRDALILASFGAEVLMIERQPMMAALLEDGLKRMSNEGSHLCLSLLKQDAKDYLYHLAPEAYPDVIYIDPMHPVRKKSALVKKEMQILQELIGPDLDAGDLISFARSRVRERVVVKWPARLAPLFPPNRSILGKTVRFDIYTPQKSEPRPLGSGNYSCK